MDPDLPVDFSSFGKEEEAQLEGMSAQDHAEDTCPSFTGQPLVVNTPQPEVAPPTPAVVAMFVDSPQPKSPVSSTARPQPPDTRQLDGPSAPQVPVPSTPQTELPNTSLSASRHEQARAATGAAQTETNTPGTHPPVVSASQAPTPSTPQAKELPRSPQPHASSTSQSGAAHESQPSTPSQEAPATPACLSVQALVCASSVVSSDVKQDAGGRRSVHAGTPTGAAGGGDEPVAVDVARSPTELYGTGDEYAGSIRVAAARDLAAEAGTAPPAARGGKSAEAVTRVVAVDDVVRKTPPEIDQTRPAEAAPTPTPAHDTSSPPACESSPEVMLATGPAAKAAAGSGPVPRAGPTTDLVPEVEPRPAPEAGSIADPVPDSEPSRDPASDARHGSDSPEAGTGWEPQSSPSLKEEAPGRLAQIIADIGIPTRHGSRIKQEAVQLDDDRDPDYEPGAALRLLPPPPPPSALADVHCLVCNDPLELEDCVQLTEHLENAPIRIEEKIGNIINNDYRLYLHSEVVCDRCHHTLCEIHELEVQTKQLRNQVVGFFWDTVEVRRVRPQRKGRRKSRPSKLLLEAAETAMYMPDIEFREDSPVIYKAPQKKLSRSNKPKCYEKLSNNEYKCIRCHKILPRVRAVTKHFDLVHGKKEQQCHVCEKYFRDRVHLLRHKQKLHSETLEEPEPDEPSDVKHETDESGCPPAGEAEPEPEPEPEPESEAGPSAEPPVDDEPADDDESITEREPVIEDEFDEEAEMEQIDEDVVMNIEVERPRRGRKRRYSSRSSSMGNELGTMYTEDVEGSSPRFKCMLCPNTYSRPAKARDHFIAKHAQIKRFKCSLCTEMFLTYKQKRHHELSHTAEVCTKCGKKYPGNKRGMLDRHISQCGEVKKCRVCGAEFDSTTEFIKHRRDAHEKNATCDVCGKVVSARNLASHRAIHSDERNYTCHLCGSSFKAKGSLDTHLRTHSEDRPFSCDQCGRSFKHRNNWKDHERGHLNIRDFVCHFCSKSFKQAKNLKQHLRQHDANPEIFTCPHCPSTFKYKYNMLAHVKTLHTGEMGRRVRRRMRAPSELDGSLMGAHGPALHVHSSMSGVDALQLSPSSVTSDSNSGVHVQSAAAGAAAAAASTAARSLPQLNPLNTGVVFMQTLQHHSIFSS